MQILHEISRIKKDIVLVLKWHRRIGDKIDITIFMICLIENYPSRHCNIRRKYV